jgi:hypothetical protein
MDLELMRMRQQQQHQQQKQGTAASEQGLKESLLAKYKSFDWTQA